MPKPEEALARIDSLIQIGLRLAMSTTSGKIVLAKLAANIDRSWVAGPLAGSLGPALDAAAATVPPPLTQSEVEEILCEAWGIRRVEDELDLLEPEPAAFTHTSQVHRAVHDGRPVAVKVLRPGVASAFRQDLALLDTLVAPLSVAFPELDPGALLAEARERVLDELDLENEAQLMHRLHRALRGGAVVIPAPVTELCTESVLVSSWLEGRSLAGEVGLGHDLTAVTLLRFVLGGIREGVVHCDLDLDDLRRLEDGHLAILDFGAVAGVQRGRADGLLMILDAFVENDADALDAALVAVGALEAGHGRTALLLARRVLGPLAGTEPTRLDTAAVGDLLRRIRGAEAELIELVLAARLDPADLYPARGVGQLFSVIARLGATAVWPQQIRAALAEGWQA